MGPSKNCKGIGYSRIAEGHRWQHGLAHRRDVPGINLSLVSSCCRLAMEAASLICRSKKKKGERKGKADTRSSLKSLEGRQVLYWL